MSDQLLLLAESARSAAEAEVAEVREEKGCVDLAADTCSRSERRKITAAEALIVEGKNSIQAGN